MYSWTGGATTSAYNENYVLPTQLQGIRCESLKNEGPFQMKKLFQYFVQLKVFED